MASLVSYEQRISNIRTEDSRFTIQYVKCSPPSRLTPKGVVVLLHDYFRTSYQFRYVIDLLGMGGYTTIVPDLMNLSGKPDGSTALKMLASGLSKFLSGSYADTCLHLVGCGLGADVAVEIAIAHPSLVGSIICSDGISETQAQQVMNLSASSTKNDILQAFQADLEESRSGNELLSKYDVEEYADAYSCSTTISGMQDLFRRRTKSLTMAQVASTSFAPSNPEQQPEEWAVTVLSLLNLSSAKPLMRRARL